MDISAREEYRILPPARPEPPRIPKKENAEQTKENGDRVEISQEALALSGETSEEAVSEEVSTSQEPVA